MTQEILNIILSAIGVIITGLASWAVTYFTKWISTKIKDQKAATYLATIVELTTNAVKEVYQTYVEALKNSGTFDEAAQKTALNKCLETIKSELAPEVVSYITTNFGDMTAYLTSLIESTIYSLKN